ncbi:MAG: DUF2332 domain-containing protein [Gemmobacter sp.]
MTADKLRAAFQDQARSCAALGSPLTARLLEGLAEGLTSDTATGARILGWPGEPSSRGDSVTLRLAGGLHALVLSGRDAGLAAAYAAGDPVAAALAAIARHDAFLHGWLDSPPQTNEVRRSAALIVAAQWLQARHPLPLVLSEAGASAGLNLIWDRYALEVPGASYGPPDPVLRLAPDWRGLAPPAPAPVVIADRAGADIAPVDPQADRIRLMAYVWADQPDRLARTALAADEAARLRPPVIRADAVDWLARRLATLYPGRLHLIQHTVAWQYFSTATQARGEALIAAAGARATADAPLARVSMEADGAGEGAALTLTLWSGGGVVPLGRADFHGRWIDWRAP